LYESEGFLVFGRRNNYYRSCDRAEDAFVMEWVLEPASVMMKWPSLVIAVERLTESWWVNSHC